MKIDDKSLIPIYIQIADAIEDDIIDGRLSESGSCYSQLVLAKELHVNPATAAKGIQLLVTRGVLTRQRGQAMTIVDGAADMIRSRRLQEELYSRITELILSAKRLGISKDHLIKEISASPYWTSDEGSGVK